MTNTLHRFGDADSFRDDYVIFAIPARSNNPENTLPALRRFLEIAIEFKPVNLGDARNGGALRPSRSLSPLNHWWRDSSLNYQAVLDGLTHPTTCSAVFDNPTAAEDFLKKKIWASASISPRRLTGPSSAAIMPAFHDTV